MGLPIKTFWLMNSNIDRIEAQLDVRTLMVGISSQGAESATEHRDRLIVEIGTTVVMEDSHIYDAPRDEAGFEELRMMQ